jgi:hypothetical protein
MSVKNIVKAIPASQAAYGVIQGTFNPINPAGLPQACFLLRVINGTNEPIDISYDDVDQHDYLPAGQTLNLNAQTNSQPQNQAALVPIGTIVYIRYSVGAPSSGDVYLAGYYQPNNP